MIECRPQRNEITHSKLQACSRFHVLNFCSDVVNQITQMADDLQPGHPGEGAQSSTEEELGAAASY